MKEEIIPPQKPEAEEDYRDILKGMLTGTSQDYWQVRALVHKVERSKLRADPDQVLNEVGWLGTHEQLRALGSAISRFETELIEKSTPPRVQSERDVNQEPYEPAIDVSVRQRTEHREKTEDTECTEDRAEPAEERTDAIEHLAQPEPSQQIPAIDDEEPIAVPSFIRASPSQKPPIGSFLQPSTKFATGMIAADYDAPIPSSFFASAALARQRSSQLLDVYEVKPPWTARRVAKGVGKTALSSMQLVIAAALGAAIYTAFAPHMMSSGLLGTRAVETESGSLNTVTKQAANSPQGNKNTASLGERAYRPGVGGIPVPTEYGVYALVDGQLTDLDLLPIRVPDPRISISPPFSTPSRVHLPAGQLQFVIFRRDLVNSAPDRAEVRVIARVARALSFNSSGKATVNNVDESWVVRSNSYEMKVAPVADNPEMILIRPEHPEFVFPAGRYALVLKGVAYDFTLDGPMVDSTHCLERTEAMHAPIYTECRSL